MSGISAAQLRAMLDEQKSSFLKEQQELQQKHADEVQKLIRESVSANNEFILGPTFERSQNMGATVSSLLVHFSNDPRSRLRIVLARFNGVLK